MIVTVFGSISVRSLTAEERTRVETIASLGATILLSDAAGVDAAVQALLAERGYRNVHVYHRGARPRCNIGQWPAVAVPGTYTDKDRAMCSAAGCALAIWDGRSKGTRRNLDQLRREGKRVRLVSRRG